MATGSLLQARQELENAEGAKGVFEAQGQLQIIFGTGTVNKVYDEFIQLAGIEGGSKEDVKQAARTMIQALHVNGGGLIGESEINRDVPLANVEAFYTAWDE